MASPSVDSACRRASWQLPGPDFHRQATTSLRTRRSTMAYVTASPPVLLGARKTLCAAQLAMAWISVVGGHGVMLGGLPTPCRHAVPFTLRCRKRAVAFTAPLRPAPAAAG